ncbi:unnamed protein product (macronuclear) [Paramecium tetraurelia]|uniref:Transmembrane protein n=1 Tax=Paramecium tetraurelia TaxID=5888 RepID=A0BSU0_PARTE|nr:uncharacterized protein GSPATT00031839001 [Paramecium tetraurelia]CAK61607.1 unnamed protein product [Paramecium tetraurelia]|eukprot:XP_001429005.1 hypothetical protein (macronuclear) [Paramecium tetraurelia strain d4-2]
MYQIQDKSAQEYQSYLSKHLEDSRAMTSLVFNCFIGLEICKFFLFILQRNKNVQNQLSQQPEQNQSKQDDSKMIKIETTLRSTEEQSNLDTSPITQCEDGQNQRIKNKLKSLIGPIQQRSTTKNRQLTLPYFSKNQLNIKPSHFFVTNQDCEINQSLDNNSNINSLIRNKSSMFSREMKRIRIQTEC